MPGWLRGATGFCGRPVLSPLPPSPGAHPRGCALPKLSLLYINAGAVGGRCPSNPIILSPCAQRRGLGRCLPAPPAPPRLRFSSAPLALRGFPPLAYLPSLLFRTQAALSSPARSFFSFFFPPQAAPNPPGGRWESGTQVLRSSSPVAPGLSSQTNAAGFIYFILYIYI